MTQWYCPTCGGPNTFPGSEEIFQCSYCERQLGLYAIACPSCGQVTSHLEDNCPDCGEPLTSVGAIFQRHETAGQPPVWLERSRLQARSIQSSAMAASDARMDHFLELERERMAELRRADQAQRANDKRIMMVALAIGAAILIFLLGFGLLMASSP